MRKILILLPIIIIITAYLLTFTDYTKVIAQVEPPSPEEEWYPPAPSGGVYSPMPSQYKYGIAGIGPMPSPGTLNLLFRDINLKIRTEFYDKESFYLEFVSPFNSFYIFLYEYYPPGNVPRGHWLIYGAGPITTGAGVRVDIGLFIPETNEPEGQHVWKCWLYNSLTGGWATGIARFNYFKFPRVEIETVEYPQELIVGRSYELKVYVRNLGEIDYTYSVEVEGAGVSFTSKQQTVSITSQSQSVVTFPFTVLMSGTLNVRISVFGDHTLLDSKSVSLTSKILKPGPMIAGDINPKVLREGEDVSLSLTFMNRGEGEARQVYLNIEAPGFMIINSGSFSPNVSPGGYGSAVFTLRPLEGGYKTIRVTITYSDIIGNTYTDTIQYSSLLVLVKFKVYSQDKDGNILQIPIVINGKTNVAYEEWIDPTKDIAIEAPRVVEKENVPYLSNIRYVFEQWSDGNTVPQRKVSLTKSLTLIAVYRVEYTLTYIAYAAIIVAVVLVIGISLLLFLKKKPKKVPPPPPS